MAVKEIEQFVIDKVRTMRKEAKISQAGLAYLLDVSEGFVGDIESSGTNKKYTIRHLNELAKIFKCSPKDFLPNKPF